MVHLGAKRKAGIYKSYCACRHFPMNTVRFITSFYNPRNRTQIVEICCLMTQKNNVRCLQSLSCMLTVLFKSFRHAEPYLQCNSACDKSIHTFLERSLRQCTAWNQYLMRTFSLFPLELQWISSQTPTRLWKIFESQLVIPPSLEEILTRTWISFLVNEDKRKRVELKRVRETWFETWSGHTPRSSIT